MESKQVTMNFRVDGDLKTAFERVAADMDQTASQMLRAYMRHAVTEHARKHAQKDLFPAPGATKAAAEVKPPAPTQNAPKARKKGPFDHVPRRGERK